MYPVSLQYRDCYSDDFLRESEQNASGLGELRLGIADGLGVVAQVLSGIFLKAGELVCGDERVRQVIEVGDGSHGLRKI